MTDSYMIVRFFKADRPIEIKKRGLTKEQAKAHCASHKGSGAGWSDGFTKE